MIEGRGGNDLLTGGPGSEIASFASATTHVTFDAALTTAQALLRASLAAHRAVVVRVTVVVTDAAAGKLVLRRSIALRR